MLILLALLCAPADDYKTEMADAKHEMILASKRIADSTKDQTASTAILMEMQSFLARDKLPTNPLVLPARDNYVARRAVARYKMLEATPESERRALQAKWKHDDSDDAPLKRRKWVTVRGGWFQGIGGDRWGEFGLDGKMSFEFRETGRTADYVEIFDVRRRIAIRLLSAKSIVATKPNEWGDQYQGVWTE